MSGLLKRLRSTTGGPEIGPGPSKKLRLVNGTKMLLDIAKESADAFPPLKSCLGGITALIRHYEESQDVQDKLGDLIPWLIKLKGSVTTGSAGGNVEEAERREELIRSLDDIENQSQALLGKGRFGQILDKTQDSGIVVNLIEQLRRAILLYQLSQQKSIDNQVNELAVSFNEYLKLRETTSGTTGKIESILARLRGLNLGASTTEDEDEYKRRTVLLEALRGIESKLHSISERSNAVGYRENDADVQAVCELAEHVRDAIVEYQLAQQKAIYEQNCKMIDSDELTALNTCRRAHGAGCQHGNRNGCLKGTRESVLDKIELWAGDPATSPVFWLNGLAGTGKSTIAQTIAERTFADGRLGASFFCSRSVEDRSNLHLIFPTLAFQLAQKYSDCRSSLITLLQSNPDIVHESLLSQMQRLIVDPLLSARISTVIVIDALDECKDEDPESAILLVLGQLVSKIPEVKFFITSRPETHIMSGFRGPLLKNATDVFVLHQVERSTVDNDIRLFFKHELSKLAHQKGTSRGWPTDDQVDSLCRRAAGFFVYAVATVKFLQHRFRRPSDRLEVIMASPEITVHEGQAGLKVYNSLDSLYASILRTAFSQNNVDDDALARSVLSAVVLVTNPLSPSAIANLMDSGCDVVVPLLESVRSLLVLDEDIDQPARPFHKSFPDFITDPSRCSDTRFYISPDLHADLVLRCLGLMDRLLKKNMFSIPDYALNSDVEGLRSLGETTLGGALVYACMSWYNHLVTTEHLISDVLSALHRFLERRFLFWLEVLSVLGVLGDAARALTATLKWLNEIKVPEDFQPLFDTAKDCLRFVTEFFEVISQSAPHIYHSALPLAPASSIIRKLYSQQISSVARVVTGIPTSWDSCTAITSGRLNATWSPCGKYVAASSGGGVEVRDSTTLEISCVLKLPRSEKLHQRSLAFSPNGRLMIAVHDRRRYSLPPQEYRRLVVWDIQTGVVIKELDTEIPRDTLDECQMNELAILVHVCLRDVELSARVPHGDQREPRVWQLGSHWFHGESLYFVTHSNSEISIREFQPNPTELERPPAHKLQPIPTLSHHVVQSFCVPPQDGKFSFSPVSFHASFVTWANVVILDVRNSNTLLHDENAFYEYEPGNFSPDGCLFACITQKHQLSIWKNTPAGYIPWSTVQPRTYCEEFSFSPTSTSLLAWGSGGMQLLCPDNGSATPTPNTMWGIGCNVVTSSTDGTRIAVASQGGSPITVLDAISGTPQYTLDAWRIIQSMRLVDNTLLVLGEGGLARWDLETDGARKVGVGVDHWVRHNNLLVDFLALSIDGTQIVGIDSKARPENLVLYDVESRQIVSSCLLSEVPIGRHGVRLSPCGLKVYFWSRGLMPDFSSGFYCTEVEIEGGHFAGSAKHCQKDLWTLHALLSSSCDGFHVGRGGRWVEDSGGRKVFWLPPDWNVEAMDDVDDAVWDGNFLALANSRHEKPIIIQFKP